jgi:hypothetical protein
MAHFEQGYAFCGLVHLIDGVIHRCDEILDVAAVERRDEGAAYRSENLARNFVGFGFAREDLPAIMLDAVAVVQQAVQFLGASDHKLCVAREQLEKALFLRHQCLEPAEHRCLACRDGSTRGDHRSRGRGTQPVVCPTAAA